jgi:hypothetical protein
MAKIQKLTTEEARKQFAELLNGSQFRSEHTEITRHGKVAGVLVPGDWYTQATQALADVKALRKELAARPAEPTGATGATEQEPAIAAPAEVAAPSWLRQFPDIAALTQAEARDLVGELETRRPEWFHETRKACLAEPPWVNHAMLAADADDPEPPAAP